MKAGLKAHALTSPDLALMATEMSGKKVAFQTLFLSNEVLCVKSSAVVSTRDTLRDEVVHLKVSLKGATSKPQRVE